MDLFLFCFFSVLCLLCLCARLFIYALWSPAGKGLTSWLLFVVSYCEFVTLPLVFWVFLIFAPLLTLTTHQPLWAISVRRYLITRDFGGIFFFKNMFNDLQGSKKLF